MGIHSLPVLPTHSHHVCCYCSQGQEGFQAQGGCCPPSLRCHDHICHQEAGRQEGLLPPGHPQVHRGQQQGRRRQGCCPCPSGSQEDARCQEVGVCCCCWQEGSWLLQAACQGAQEASCQEACCQEGC